MDERLKRQLDFALEIDKEKNILRQTHLSEHGRRENDAEHAWHMAIMAYLFREHSNESVDIAKVMPVSYTHLHLNYIIHFEFLHPFSDPYYNEFLVWRLPPFFNKRDFQMKLLKVC